MQKEITELQAFTNTFDPIQNALQMRTLRRWNGRDLRDEENLAEHSHLVVVCLMELLEEFKKYDAVNNMPYNVETLVKYALYHDSLELLRGDILSITKNYIPGLKSFVDNEEEQFLTSIIKIKLNDVEKDILELADLKACYKFIEWELRYPSNDFAKTAYVQTKGVYDEKYIKFCMKNHIVPTVNNFVPNEIQRFMKGYAADAGVDIIMNKTVTFLPMSTTTIDLDVQITPERGQMAFLCARTSAANKGLSVAACPIDPYYTGNVSAIVHNMSNDVITYNKGEAFCQYVMIKIITPKAPAKKKGKRTVSKFGGTDKC